MIAVIHYYPVTYSTLATEKHISYLPTQCRLVSVRYADTSERGSYCVNEDACGEPCTTFTVEYLRNDGMVNTTTLFWKPDLGNVASDSSNVS